MTEVLTDQEMGTVVINDTDINSDQLISAMESQSPELAAMVRWGALTQTKMGGIFDRDRFVTPNGIFSEMQIARDAVEHDDVVSGVADTIESLAFSKLDFESMDEDEEDIWNQIAADIDLDSRIREIWREGFICSQVYVAVLWGRKTYKVRGRSKTGVQRKKVFKNLKVPTAISILDPLKVVPVGSLMFNAEKLAYIAGREEAAEIDKVLAGEAKDDVIKAMILRRYEASRSEVKELQALTGDSDFKHLFLLNPDCVFRHTYTRAQYQRFSPVRMTSIFELLDLKHQLRAMDRAHLLGGTNFIVLVRKGTDAQPAKPEEVANLQSQTRMMSRVPVIVGDHRLNVDIVTPKLDSTLSPERYNGIDSRITARLFQIMNTGNYAAGAKGDDSIKLARVVARGIQSRRHMLRRALEAKIFLPTYDANDQLNHAPKLRFHPKRIDLEFDPAMANYLLDLRDRGDISRESILDEIDFSQADEANKREREAEKYDEVFKPVNVPVPGVKPADPNAEDPKNQNVDPKAAGRRLGGNRNGGGAAPGTGQGNPES